MALPQQHELAAEFAPPPPTPPKKTNHPFASLTCALCTSKGCGCNVNPDPDESRCICRESAAPQKQQSLLSPDRLASRIEEDIRKRRARVTERHNENVKLFALALQIVKKKETAGLVESDEEVRSLAAKTGNPATSPAALATIVQAVYPHLR